MAPSSTAERAASQDRAGTAERILDAAESLFAERGFAGTAIRDIAAGVGLNPASLYNHFPGKQDLYEAVLERGLRPILDLIGPSRPPTEPLGDDRVIDALVDHLAAHPDFARLLHHEALSGGENIARLGGRWLEPIYERGLDVLRESRELHGWSEEDLPLIVMALHNLILGYFSMARLFERLQGTDPLAPAAIERQRAFLREATRRLLGHGPGGRR